MADDKSSILIPSYIYGEILSWLPVKSLRRLGCVRKSWLALICTCSVVMKHTNRGVGDRSRLKFLCGLNPPRFIDYEALLLVDKDTPYAHLEPRKPDVPMFVQGNCGLAASCYLVGSCNGLICLDCQISPDGTLTESEILLVLWNPCTRETLVLPGLRTLFTSVLRLDPTIFWGFGYDSTTQDYKVILGSAVDATNIDYVGSRSSLPATPIRIAIFSLKTSSWRTVQGLEHYKLFGKGHLVNGALHWLDIEKDTIGWNPTSMSSRIISFDLAKETFQEVVTFSNLFDKEHFDRDHDLSVGIGTTVGNCLLVYVHDHYNNNCNIGVSFTIWVMKEYGIEKSWTKLAQLPSRFIHPHTDYVEPEWILENGQVLMTWEDGRDGFVALYNPNEDAFNIVVRDDYFWQSWTFYFETLVSPRNNYSLALS